MTFGRRIAAELVGTMFLLSAVVGSGIMGERLSGGNVAIALLANTIATGAALVALILTFGRISGAHSILRSRSLRHSGETMPWGEVPAYLTAQIAGALLGVALANAMFGQSFFSVSQHVRLGMAQTLSEFVATFGLLSVILGCSGRPQVVPFAVGAYITGAYWFTASTSFANPAVTVARTLTNTFSGIQPASAPAFIAAQLAGAFAATIFWSWLFPAVSKTFPDDSIPAVERRATHAG